MASIAFGLIVTLFPSFVYYCLSPLGGGAKNCGVSVCQSDRISLKPHGLNFVTFSVYVDYGSGSLLLWRCDTLCTSGFVDDVISHVVGLMARG